MYRYDEFDHQLVRERVSQFRGQVARRIDGSLTEDEFKPLRLMNGLYLQLHAYMLRVAIPYGTLSSRQMHMLANIAEKYDRGYGHFTTRQNIQYNWPKLSETPDLLHDLASVEMHAIQTSGNCIRNTTSDPFAGVAADEIEDPRPTAELIRQWSTLHPEFAYLPRKFKIAVTGSPNDRAAVYFHDIGLRLVHGDDGKAGWEVSVGGGQGRTPMIGQVIHPCLAKPRLLGYLEAIMRVYNLHGRRDNKYKARIKILVHELGIDAFRDEVDAEFERSGESSVALEAAELERIAAYFAPPAYDTLPETSTKLESAKATDPAFAAWCDQNLMAHKIPGYTALTVTIKRIDGEPGDATTAEMHALADLAETYSLGELRVTHEQNIVFPNVRLDDLYDLWKGLAEHNLGDANRGLVTDIIACPGLDYCALATARSIPIAKKISKQFADPARQKEIGPLAVKISGCINACGHHHVGHIGILGLDKAGEEFYQVTLGGDATETAAVGTRTGPGFSSDEVAPAIERLVDHYIEKREGSGETFLEAYRRLGPETFKEALYATD